MSGARNRRGFGCLILIIAFFVLGAIGGIIENPVSLLVIVPLLGAGVFGLYKMQARTRRNILQWMRSSLWETEQTVGDGRAEADRYRQLEQDAYEDEVSKIVNADESIESLRYMTGAEFENFMADFLETQGYQVEHLAGSGDQGVDLILTQGEKRIAVQLKQYTRPLGNKPVQEVFAGRFIHKANEAWVIATSSFTKGGVKAARKTRVSLIDGDELFRWIEEASEERGS